MSIPKLSTVSTAALAVLTGGRLLLEAGMLDTEREVCKVEGTLNIAGVEGVIEGGEEASEGMEEIGDDKMSVLVGEGETCA